MKHRGRKTSCRVAIAAACVLILQSIGSAFAIGSAGPHPQLDAFGNSICVTSDGGIHSGGSDGENSQRPECCTISCNMSVQPTGVPTDSGWIFFEPHVSVSTGTRPWLYRPARLSADGAVHPRAPPLRT